ncbi:MAG: pyridoxamine 5'-phosphate oxidase family protein [Firmicutes bacterium]|nr:pyridoxamine 5'-phosphate oxidase family protein [Bacillota bacterium]
MTEQLIRETESYLENHHVMTLATTGEDGPWASAVFYVNTGFNLYFFTEGNTRHGRNLAANPLVAAAIHEDYHDWREIKGIQLQGEAVPVGPVEKARIITLFTIKFASLSVFMANPKTAAIVARAQIYKLVPREIWYLDNQKGFSARQKITIDCE